MAANRFNLVIPDDLIKEAKIKGIKEEIDVSKVVEVWLREWVAGTRPTPDEARETGKEGAASQVLEPAFA
jgi:hypothetical protein